LKNTLEVQSSDTTELTPTLNDKVNAYWEHLFTTFPTLFDKDNPKPLAIHIHKDLFKTRPDGTPKRVVRLFLSRWTRRKNYRQALAVGGHRFALSGMPDGSISPEHQEAVVSARSIRPPESVT
jgi:sRNA-binding protein